MPSADDAIENALNGGQYRRAYSLLIERYNLGLWNYSDAMLGGDTPEVRRLFCEVTERLATELAGFTRNTTICIWVWRHMYHAARNAATCTPAAVVCPIRRQPCWRRWLLAQLPPKDRAHLLLQLFVEPPGELSDAIAEILRLSLDRAQQCFDAIEDQYRSPQLWQEAQQRWPGLLAGADPCADCPRAPG